MQTVAPERNVGGERRQRSSGSWGFAGSTPLALLGKVIGLGLVAAITLGLAFPLIDRQEWVLLGLLVISAVAIFVIYLQPRRIPPKYLVPGMIFLIIFQVLPVLFTISTSVTNFGDGHRGTKQDAILAIEGASVQEVPDGISYVLTIAARGTSVNGDLAFLLYNPDTAELLLGTAKGLEPAVGAQVSSTGKVTAMPGYTLLTFGDVSGRSAEISEFTVPTAKGAIRASGLSRAYEGIKTRAYDSACDCIKDSESGQTWTANNNDGLFVNSAGDKLAQGWQVNVGLGNFAKVFGDQTLRTYFLGILVWNFAFALLVVFGTFAVGLAMAMALNHPRVKALKLYRVLIVLPYAMPAFAMLLVWRDMFNQDFGLINNLTGLDVNWMGDQWAAKVAVIIIQFWLGYPYMFLVCTGALQSIPTDLVEAASVDGATKGYAFRTVTLPLLFVATAPLLISSFAFNFNNYNAIGLTTEGGPFPPDSPTAGATDLLISYTYRLAFGESGAQYGFAAAVSLLIFLIVAGISIVSFRRTAVLEEIN